MLLLIVMLTVGQQLHIFNVSNKQCYLTFFSCNLSVSAGVFFVPLNEVVLYCIVIVVEFSNTTISTIS